MSLDHIGELPEVKKYDRLMNASFDSQRNLPQFLRAPKELADAALVAADREVGRLKAITPEELAEKFHATYEGAAEAMGYTTRRDSAVPWAQVPKKNKALMVATCAEVLAWMHGRTKRETP